ncbi:MAG: S-layer homology domain-containing protein [Thermoleophilia bacterium]|nr:S-layer homology domain-containing protein [Thermoleophilia bacterium]
MKNEPVACSLTTKRHRRRLIVVIATAILVIALATSAASLALADTPAFPDVPGTHPNHAAITDLASRGVVSGYVDGTFGPGDEIKRQQFAKMIVLAGAYPVSESDICPFVDVEIGGPATLFPDNYVAVCAANGITLGKTATSFDPYTSITRLQVVSMVIRAADDLRPGLLATPPDGWTSAYGWDVDATHGANAARAEYNDLLAGLDASALAPNGYMTRGEVAQVLFNLLTKMAPSVTTTTDAGSATTTTTAASTTTTSAATTTTTDSGSSSSSTTVTTAKPAPPVDHSIAGRESASVTVTVNDQFGNPMPGVEVFLTTEILEGEGLVPLSLSLGNTDGFGHVAHTWQQDAAGAWGVEEITARVENGTPEGLTSAVKLIQWVYDDTGTDHIGAAAGQQKVSVFSGYSLWNGLVLHAYLNPKGTSLGHGTYVSSEDLSFSTNLHTWASGQAFFVGAASADDDDKPNWMYNVVP